MASDCSRAGARRLLRGGEDCTSELDGHRYPAQDAPVQPAQLRRLRSGQDARQKLTSRTVGTETTTLK